MSLIIILLTLTQEKFDNNFYVSERWINASYDFYGLNSYFAERKWLFYRIMFI